jgi:hypothetical protein
MKAEALEEADRCRKHQSSDKGKREGTIVDLPFMLIIRAKKARQEQDRSPRSNDGQSKQGRTERRNLTLNANSNDREKGGEIKECECGSTATGEIISNGLIAQDGPPQRHHVEYVTAIYLSSIRYLLYAIRLLRITDRSP